IDYAHVAPEHACAQSRAQRLGAGLLGGEALGIGLEPVGAALGLGSLGWRKDTCQKALAMAIDHALDAAHVAQVGADADDHGLSLGASAIHGHAHGSHRFAEPAKNCVPHEKMTNIE